MLQRIGRYEILERIATGGQGTVYRARDTVLDRIVAVKIINQSIADDPAYLEALQREARLAAGLDHPNITTVYDFQVEDGIPYIVMEYVPDALDRHLQGGTRLPWERAAEIAVQIARALQHAHDYGVVHRDIKPQNILLTEDGTVKVSDFGIARALASSTRSRTASVVGTPEYMSPEQWSSGSLDGRLDQYSLGIVFYQMLVGTTPFQGESMEAIYVQHRETPLPALPRNLQVPRAVQQVIRRATEKSQGNRYASSGEMADALEVALGRTPTGGGQSTQQQPPRQPPQPPRQPAGSGSGGRRTGGLPGWLLFGGLGAILMAVISIVIAMYAAGGSGGDGEMVQLAAPAPTHTPYPTPTAMPTPTATPGPAATILATGRSRSVEPTVPAPRPLQFPNTAGFAVYFIDVGQGDATLIVADDGSSLLIDGGRSKGRIRERLNALNIEDLDAIAATHPDADHIGGLIEVLGMYDVERIFLNGGQSSSKTFATFSDLVRQEGATISVLQSNNTIQLGDMSINVIHPAGLTGDANSDSLVLQLGCGDVVVLLTGDAEISSEISMLNGGKLRDVDVLKVGHHGSKSSTSQAFLNVVQPEVAIISAGQNSQYGHPHAEVMDRLRRSDVEILHTDTSEGDDTLKMVSDCQTVSFTTPQPITTPGVTRVPTTATPQPSSLRSPSATPTPFPTPTLFPTYTPFPTPTPTPTQIPIATPMPVPTPSPTPIPAATPTPTPTPTPQPTSTPTSIPTSTPVPTPTSAPLPTTTPVPTMTPTPVPPGNPDVVIECIFFDGVVIRNESDEFVQITNRGSVSADMGDWSLRDVSDGSPTFTFPSYTLAPSKSIRVYTNEVHIEWGGFSFGYGLAIWNNSNPDVAALSDAQDQEVSRKSYPPGC